MVVIRRFGRLGRFKEVLEVPTAGGMRWGLAVRGEDSARDAGWGGKVGFSWSVEGRGQVRGRRARSGTELSVLRTSSSFAAWEFEVVMLPGYAVAREQLVWQCLGCGL